MKNSINNTQDATPVRQQPCSEKACATCFENGGCIYEHYLIAATHFIKEYQTGNRINAASLINKRA
ncbi:MAG: hypothetical protein WDN26_04885 [Chitinophagaceae bacterium]